MNLEPIGLNLTTAIAAAVVIFAWEFIKKNVLPGLNINLPGVDPKPAPAQLLPVPPPPPPPPPHEQIVAAINDLKASLAKDPAAKP